MVPNQGYETSFQGVRDASVLMTENRALDTQFASKTLEEYSCSAMVVFPRFVKLYQLYPFYLRKHTYASQDYALFRRLTRNPEIAWMHCRQTCVLLSATYLHVLKIHKQETGTKESLNWNALAKFWKSAFWFYSVVHISSKWLFL